MHKSKPRWKEIEQDEEEVEEAAAGNLRRRKQKARGTEQSLCITHRQLLRLSIFFGDRATTMTVQRVRLISAADPMRNYRVNMKAIGHGGVVTVHSSQFYTLKAPKQP